VCWHGRFSIIPLQATLTDPLLVSYNYNYTVNRIHHYLSFYVRITAKDWILLKLRVTARRCRCCDDVFQSQSLPSHNSVNIGSIMLVVVYKCSLWYHLNTMKSTRYGENIIISILSLPWSIGCFLHQNFSDIFLHQYRTFWVSFWRKMLLVIESS